jgi:hypothetical protein
MSDCRWIFLQGYPDVNDTVRKVGVRQLGLIVATLRDATKPDAPSAMLDATVPNGA